MGENKTTFTTQNIILENRGNLTITGIEQVESFNDNTIILNSIKGGIVIKGNELNISNLNLERGNLNIEGTINSITYSNKDNIGKNSLFGKMFK